MSHAPQLQWRDIRICCAAIERVYGRGNFDDAGDVLLAELATIVGRPDQYSCCFDFDRTHLNPWYHVMIFSVGGISEVHYRALLERLAALGLMDE